MIAQLLRKVEESDRDGVSALLENEISKEGQAWAIHLSLFPLAQRVLNPPFINPHLPKMYRIYRELSPYLEEDEIPALLRLEINEYTQRPKSKELRRVQGETIAVSFSDIETAIREQNEERVAMLLNAFLNQEGADELARRLILLGSGYLDQSLGHSVSCTAFILLEMIERSDEDDPWPALTTLADYFCKGGFHTTPRLQGTEGLPSSEAINQHLLRATSGSGLVNLHHTIARYSIERVRHFLSKEEYAHIMFCWIAFMGSKSVDTPSLISPAGALCDYNSFFESFSKRAERPVLALLEGMIPSEKDRRYLGRYLIKGVCDLYQGDYNPHFLTGLGSTLWVVNNYWNEAPIAVNALRQYLDYYFTQMTS
jgi:hypothetical protein